MNKTIMGLIPLVRRIYQSLEQIPTAGFTVDFDYFYQRGGVVQVFASCGEFETLEVKSRVFYLACIGFINRLVIDRYVYQHGNEAPGQSFGVWSKLGICGVSQ